MTDAFFGAHDVPELPTVFEGLTTFDAVDFDPYAVPIDDVAYPDPITLAIVGISNEVDRVFKESNDRGVEQILADYGINIDPALPINESRPDPLRDSEELPAHWRCGCDPAPVAAPVLPAINSVPAIAPQAPVAPVVNFPPIFRDWGSEDRQ